MKWRDYIILSVILSLLMILGKSYVDHRIGTTHNKLKALLSEILEVDFER